MTTPYRFTKRDKFYMRFWPFQVWRWISLTLRFLKLTQIK